MSPSVLSVVDDSLYVLNFSFGLNRYSISSDSIQYIDDITSPYPPLDFCLNNGLAILLPADELKSLARTLNRSAGNTLLCFEFTGFQALLFYPTLLHI